MKILCAFTLFAVFMIFTVSGTTISVVPIYEPLSLHGTDVDDALSEIGDTLQASVMARPMAISGAMPEDLVSAIRSPHQLPSNTDNYKTQEANLLVLCNINIQAEIIQEILTIQLDVSLLSIPSNIDLTSRQILKLAIIAIRKTLEDYQRSQSQKLSISLSIEGTDSAKASLRDLNIKFIIPEKPSPN